MATIFICKFPLCHWRCQSGEEFCSPHLFFVDANHRCHNCLSSIPPEFDHLKLCAQCHQAWEDCVGGHSPPQPPSDVGRSPPKKAQKSSKKDFPSLSRGKPTAKAPQKWGCKPPTKVTPCVAPHIEVSEKQPNTIPLQSDSIPIVKSPSPVKPLSPVDHLLADI